MIILHRRFHPAPRRLIRTLCLLLCLGISLPVSAHEHAEAITLDPELLKTDELSAARSWLDQHAAQLDDATFLSLLNEQIRAGRLAASHLLLDLDRSPQLADARGVTALMVACYYGHDELVRRLLTEGASIEQRALNGYACFDYALESSRRDVMRTLVSRWLGEMAQPSSQSDRLTRDSLRAADAILNSDADRLSQLIDASIQLNAYNQSNYAPLPLAVRLNEEALVEQLLKAGAWVGIGNDGDDQAIPLNQAARGNRMSLATLLLDWQASPNKPNGRGYTALMLAAMYGHLDMLDLLLEHGADPHRINHDGDHALSLALVRESMPVIHRLIAADTSGLADSLRQARDRILDGQLGTDMAEALHQVDNFGLPLSVYLLRHTDDSLLSQAIEMGLDVHQTDQTLAGRSLLQHAVRMGRVDLAERLLSAGADPQFVSRRGASIMALAGRSADPKMQQLFSQTAVPPSPAD